MHTHTHTQKRVRSMQELIHCKGDAIWNRNAVTMKQHKRWENRCARETGKMLAHYSDVVVPRRAAFETVVDFFLSFSHSLTRSVLDVLGISFGEEYTHARTHARTHTQERVT